MEGSRWPAPAPYEHEAVLRTELENSPHLSATLSVVRFSDVFCPLPPQPHGLRFSTPNERYYTQVSDDHGFGLVCTPKENIYCLSGSQLYYGERIATTSSYCTGREHELPWKSCFTSSFDSLFSLIFGHCV